MVERRIKRNHACHTFALFLATLFLGTSTQLKAIFHFETNAGIAIDHLSFASPRLLNTSNYASKQPKKQPYRPTLVFHVGIPKTATTFLQCILCANANRTAPILDRDNYVYLGTCPWRTCEMPSRNEDFLEHRQYAFFADGNDTWVAGSNVYGPVPHTDDEILPSPLPEVAPQLMQKLEVAYRKGRNVLIIYEGAHLFTQSHIASLAQHLEPYWDVRVVVAYRRLYDWLPSKYNSVSKKKLALPWPSKSNKRGKKGAHALPFDLDNRGYFSGFVKHIESVHQHPAETALQNYRRYFSKTSLLSLHHLWSDPNASGDKYLQHLACRVMPHANYTCKAAKANQLGIGADNPSTPFDYDILAVAAYEAGLINRREERSEVADRVRLYHEEELNSTFHDFPMQCLPNATLNRLLNLSISLEKQLFEVTSTPMQEREHRKRFAKAWRKFCSVDTEQVLSDEKWRNFFASIE